MAYYCDQATGFRPAYKTIFNATGIPMNKVRAIRKELVEHGVIAYQNAPKGYGGRAVYISWKRINVFCALVERLPKRHGRFAPVRIGSEPRRKRKPKNFEEYWLGLTLEEQNSMIELFTGRKPLPLIDVEALQREERAILHPEWIRTFPAKTYTEKPDWIETYNLPF